MAADDDAQGGTEWISIGELARRTGLSPDTLRVWERRYGEPVPVRLPSGHRRYTAEDVSRLRRIAEGLALGLRPSQVLGQPDAVLENWMEQHRIQAEEDPLLEGLLTAVAHYDRETLKRELLALWQHMPAEQWLARYVGPLATAVGQRWAEGRLDVRQEHFATELLEDLLRALRIEIESEQLPLSGPPIVLSTLPEERHRIGILMVALLCAIHQVPVRLIGIDAPLEEIEGTVRETGANALAISISLSTGGPESDRRLRELRRIVPGGVEILVGGGGARGARRGPDGLRYLEDLSDFVLWLEARRGSQSEHGTSR